MWGCEEGGNKSSNIKKVKRKIMTLNLFKSIQQRKQIQSQIRVTQHSLHNYGGKKLNATKK